MTFIKRTPPPGVGGGSGGELVATNYAGVDPTGATDSTTGLLAFFKAVFEQFGPGTPIEKLGGGSGTIPAGEYKIGESGTGLDLTTLELPATLATIVASVRCSPMAIFVGNAALKKKPVVKLRPPTAELAGGLYRQFLGCRFAFGTIYRANEEGDCLEFECISDSTIEAQLIWGGRYNMLADATGTHIVTGNNLVFVNRLTGGKHGMVLSGVKEPPEPVQAQIQGNQCHIGHCDKHSGNGFVVDYLDASEIVKEEPRSAKDNTFYLGAVEVNTEWGIIEGNGENKWFIANANTNTSGDFTIVGPTTKVPFLRGVFSGTVKLNGKKADLVNTFIPPGYKAAQPAFPASKEAVENNYGRAAEYYIAGGTITVIEVDGKTVKGFTSGLIRVQPGSSIKVTWSVKPEWTVYLAAG